MGKKIWRFDPEAPDPERPFLCLLCEAAGTKTYFSETGGINFHAAKVHGRHRAKERTIAGVVEKPARRARCRIATNGQHKWRLLDAGREEWEARAIKAGYRVVCEICENVEKEAK